MVRNISKGVKVYLIKDNNRIKQALIPLNDKQQLQIIKQSDKYLTKVVPIYYETNSNYIEFEITNFLSYDIYQNSKNPFLSGELTEIFTDKINFRHLPKNSKVKVYYENRVRFGEVYSTKILFANISNRLYSYNAYLNSDGRYYDENGKSLKGMFLAAPLKYRRISSSYGMRFHPILKKYRMHHGIDYVNRVGTPIKSVADGVVIYKGWLGGYGKTVKVKHKNGYMTIYGHLRGYGNIRKGSYITQGKVIGYLGNTGMSTGAHLHFGVSRYNRWINPNRIKTSSKVILRGNQKKSFIANLKKIESEISSEFKLAMK
jgi:murein DD-endopeptidase MepM/ murein hydrolase activator NlpD